MCRCLTNVFHLTPGAVRVTAQPAMYSYLLQCRLMTPYTQCTNHLKGDPVGSVFTVYLRGSHHRQTAIDKQLILQGGDATIHMKGLPWMAQVC